MGAISATGFAPLDFFPALLPGYAALVLLIDGADIREKPARHAAGAGWAFCFGQFFVGWHWIGYAFLVDPTNHLWQMPFALVSLTAGLALYGALACGLAAIFLAKRLSKKRPRLFVFAIAMASAEWLRGHLFTGFPWNLSAYGWGASLELLQSASLMGAYGLSFLTILLGASLAEFFSGRWRAPLAMVVLFAALWAFGVYRIASTPSANVPGVHLRLVQPEFRRRKNTCPALMLRNWQRLIDFERAPRQTLRHRLAGSRHRLCRRARARCT